MPDQGAKATDKKIKKLEKQLQEIYAEAEKDIDQKMKDFNDRFAAKEQMYHDMYLDGEITGEQFKSWKRGQVFQGKMWKAKKEQIINTMVNTNAIATKMVNGAKIDVFATNANWTAYTLEHGEGINFGFGLYDASTVTRLIKENPKMLPEWKIDEPKDYIWNEKKVNRQVLQGIIQGESLDKISKRLTTNLVAQNENHMKTFARTAMTGAQNAGREQRLSEAKSMGISVVKEWMATLDGRTRTSHRALDGEKIKVGDRWHPMKFSNGCRYPGDPEGPASEVYNCRCTLVGDIEDYPEEYERYDNIEGKPIENMTYKEWEKAKKDTQTLEVYRKRIAEVEQEITDRFGSYFDGDYGTYDWNEHDHKEALDDLGWQTDSMQRNLKSYIEIEMGVDKDENPELYKACEELIKKASEFGKFGYESFMNDPKSKELIENALGILPESFGEDDFTRIYDSEWFRKYYIKVRRIDEIKDYLTQYDERVLLINQKGPLEEAVKKLTKEMKQAQEQRMLAMSEAKVKAQESYIRRLQKEMRDLKKIEQDPTSSLDDWMNAVDRQKKLASKIADAKEELKQLKSGKGKKKAIDGDTSPRICDWITNITEKTKIGGLDADVHRVAEKLGISDEEALEAINTGLSKIIDECDFVMRIRADNLKKVLNEGYFKSQHETHTSEGMNDPDRRKKLEKRIFDVPIDGIEDADRPVYGMFAPKWNPDNESIKEYYDDGPGSWYGDGVTVILKKSKVINNATMTIGDSLDYQWDLAGMDVADIHYNGGWDDGRHTHKIAKLTPESTPEEVTKIMMEVSKESSDTYFEYQLHGKETHAAGNIDFVVISEDRARYDPDLLQLLDDMGIPYVINDV